MQKRLHNFMDKMQEKSVEERRNILFKSTVSLGIFITLFGLWNVSNNLVALNVNSKQSLAIEEEKNSKMLSISALTNNIAGVWGGVKDSLNDLNDKLGNLGNAKEVQDESTSDFSGYNEAEELNNEIQLGNGIVEYVE